MGGVEDGTGTTLFSEKDWHYSLLDVDWDTNSPAVELPDVHLDAAQWSSLDDLLVDDNHGCSFNNLLLSTELEAVGEYLIDADRRDDNNNIEEDPIWRPQIDPIVFQCPVDTELHPAALIAADRSLSDFAVVTNKSVSPSVLIDHGAFEETEYKGLRLVHLLTACAEALSQGAEDVVEVILCRLRELVSLTGSTMERVAYYLYHALLHSNANSLAHNMEPNDKSSKYHFLGALKLLHVAYPYIQIPHFTANQCILEAVAAAGGGNNVGIHIIDFDIMEGMQWPPLMETLRNNGNYDVAHLRITAIRWAEDNEEWLLYSGHTGRRLSEYASSVGLPFSFQEADLKELKEGLLPSREGEIVMVNCIWQLPHMVNLRNKSEVMEFLVSVRHLNPEAVTVATGPHGSEGNMSNFLESFCRCLEELCAIFDSLEAGLPQHGLARAMVERFFFGPAMAKRIVNSIECDPPDTRKSNVLDLPQECGYGEVSISNDNMLYAKYTLHNCVGRGSYDVELAGDHRLVLKWGCTPLVWVSTWTTWK